MRLSIVIPALNEASALPGLLTSLAPWRRAGDEVVVSDGGSDDGTRDIAVAHGARVVDAPRGRARQMNAGAAVAAGDVLWFVHADSGVRQGLREGLAGAVANGAVWGRFDVRLSGGGAALRMIAWSMNRRSRLTGIATGDQGIFVRRALFEGVGGYPDQPLMEDVALSARLRREARPACLRGPLITASRRWETHGVWRTVALMWRLRFDYWRGADPHSLYRRYYRGESS
ncbi:TIGR04283 family arsenosugar biosynthesis glycosyltransferase [Arhodomonas sp. AD133]|uniref:TIGR04283 family arsenosugar biosynthesis glycosyltransferase n=1 Tax=Arhodomonas sp. AD133 TaxID=3415009 RepID=UPI003EC14E37